MRCGQNQPRAVLANRSASQSKNDGQAQNEKRRQRDKKPIAKGRNPVPIFIASNGVKIGRECQHSNTNSARDHVSATETSPITASRITGVQLKRPCSEEKHTFSSAGEASTSVGVAKFQIAAVNDFFRD